MPMRQFAESTYDLFWGVVLKSRLIFLFMVSAVAALIWVDRYTRGLVG